jgi:hypothetical protein
MEDSLGIPEKVQVVVQTGRPGLVSEWQAQFGSPPLPKLRVELMRPVLIYRIQENAFGLSGPRRKGRIQVSLPMRIVATSRQGEKSSASGKATSRGRGHSRGVHL